MRIIKEYCPNTNKCVIRTDTYAKTYSHIRKLVSIAQYDFSGYIGEDAIEIVKYGGQRYARTFGIEFDNLLKTAPEGYTLIESLEYTL